MVNRRQWLQIGAAAVAGVGLSALAARRAGLFAFNMPNPVTPERGPEQGMLVPTLALRQTPKHGGGTHTVAWQAGTPVPTFEPQNRPRLDLAGTWRKQRVALDTDLSLATRGGDGLAKIEAEGENRHTPAYDDSAWQAKQLPMVENAMPVRAGDRSGPEQYESGVWYRRSFDVPASWRGQCVSLQSLSINYVVDIWVNGQWVGYHEGGYTPFALDVTGILRYGQPNSIALRIDNPPWASRPDIVPAGTVDWWNYTGVIHDLYLETAPRLHVVRADLQTPDLSGRVLVSAVVRNTTAQEQTAKVQFVAHSADAQAEGWQTDPRASAIAGQPVGEAATFEIRVPGDTALVVEATLTIPDPQRWTPERPALYVLAATLTAGGDSETTMYQFGIRTVATAGYTLLLNGTPVFLAGLARHEEWPDSGRTATWAKIRADLTQIRGMGANFVRTAHYPNHGSTYTLADRLGLLIAVEIPIWQYTAVEFAAQERRRIADQMWREMIWANFNHPSIIIWSADNEPFDNTRSRIPYLQRLIDDRRVNYSDGRLLIQSAAADRPGPVDPSQDLLDMAGWTMYFGIFHGSTYYEGTRDFLAVAHDVHPNMPILNTEYGIWSQGGESSEARQEEVFRTTFAALSEVSARRPDGTTNPEGFLAGIVWWTAFDWYAAPSKLQTMGLYHMDRTSAKPVAALLQAAYAAWALPPLPES